LYGAILGPVNCMAKIKDCLSPLLFSDPGVSKGGPLILQNSTSSYIAKLIFPRGVRLTLEILDTVWQPGKYNLGL